MYEQTIIKYKTLKAAAKQLGMSRIALTNKMKELYPDKPSKEYWGNYLLSLENKRVCTKCDLVKEIKEFRQYSGHICSSCTKDKISSDYKNNKDLYRNRNKAWRESNPEKSKAIYARRLANMANLSGIEKQAYIDIYIDCFDDYHVDHIIPLSRGGANKPSNLCYLPKSLNLQKKDKMPEECEDIMKHAYYPNLEAYGIYS